MANIVGIVSTSFIPKDGENIIEGKTVYVTEPINPKRGEGLSTDKFFLSKDKLAELSFTVALGQEIEVLYNKYGKVGTIRLTSAEFLEIE